MLIALDRRKESCRQLSL